MTVPLGLVAVSHLPAEALTLKATLKGHSEKVYLVAFSPDGKSLASTSGEAVKLWDVATGKEVASLDGHRRAVSQMAFSPDGKRLAVGSGIWYQSGPQGGTWGALALWDVAAGKRKWLLDGVGKDGPDGLGPVAGLAFSPDGNVLACCEIESSFRPGGVSLWEVSTGKKRTTLTGKEEILGPAAFLRKGKLLSCAQEKWNNQATALLLWNVETGRLDSRIKGEWIRSFVVRPDEGLLAWADWNGAVKVWDFHAGKLKQSLKGNGKQVIGLAFIKGGGLLAAADSGGAVSVWVVETGKKKAHLQASVKDPPCVTFSADGKLVAFASDDKTITIRKLAIGGPKE